MSRGLVHRSASGPREETSFSKRSRTPFRVGPVRIACVKVAGAVPH